MKVLEEEIQGDFYFGLIERDTYIEREREREREKRYIEGSVNTHPH